MFIFRNNACLHISSQKRPNCFSWNRLAQIVRVNIRCSGYDMGRWENPGTDRTDTDCSGYRLGRWGQTGDEKPPRGVGSEPGDRQDWQRISGKRRRKFMSVLSVPCGALVGGVE